MVLVDDRVDGRLFFFCSFILLLLFLPFFSSSFSFLLLLLLFQSLICNSCAPSCVSTAGEWVTDLTSRYRLEETLLRITFTLISRIIEQQVWVKRENLLIYTSYIILFWYYPMFACSATDSRICPHCMHCMHSFCRLADWFLTFFG